jgi:hypothetical protein
MGSKWLHVNTSNLLDGSIGDAGSPMLLFSDEGLLL